MRNFCIIKQTMLQMWRSHQRPCTYRLMHRIYTFLISENLKTDCSFPAIKLKSSLHPCSEVTFTKLLCSTPATSSVISRSCSSITSPTYAVNTCRREFLQVSNDRSVPPIHREYSTGGTLLCDVRYSESHQPSREDKELLKYSKFLRSAKQRFVLTPSLARTVREAIWNDNNLDKETACIICANEGPGYMSRELLQNGASRVLSLCRQPEFGPALEGITTELMSGTFQWKLADIYQLHFIGERELHPPAARIEDVLEDIDQVSWEEDIPFKIIGALPQDQERKQAYVLASLILERLSFFTYGRVQLNIFMSRNCYNTLIQPPGNMKQYRALSALYQVSCDIELLHTEPLSSFRLPPKKPKNVSPEAEEKAEDSLLLVQLTPKRDLFTKYQLENWEAAIFVFFVRQALAKRKERLARVIESWAPGSANIISEFGYDSRTVTGEVTGDQLLAIFCRICKLDNFNGAWMGEEVMGWASGRSQDMNMIELSQALASFNPT